MSMQNSAQIALPRFNTLPYSRDTKPTWWTPNLKNQAQEIVPGLWIGPLSILRDSQFLEDTVQTRVLISLTDTQIVPAIVKYKYEASPDYACYTFDPGNKKTNPLAIVSQLAEICGLIHEALDQNIATLVFCESGNEQSAVVAVAFLIYSSPDCALEVVPAIQAVQRKRGSVTLDDIAVHNLQTFRDLCRAHALCDPMKSAASGHVKIARCREEDEDDLRMSGVAGTQKRQNR